MNHEEMTDFQINCEVSKALGMSHAFWYSNSEDDFDEEIPSNKRGPIWQSRDFSVCGYIPSNGNVFNPCNSWADAGPIIQENRISIFSDSEEDYHASEVDNVYWWNAISFDTGLQHNAESNPLRAAMIVFLMMKGGE